MQQYDNYDDGVFMRPRKFGSSTSSPNKQVEAPRRPQGPFCTEYDNFFPVSADLLSDVKIEDLFKNTIKYIENVSNGQDIEPKSRIQIRQTRNRNRIDIYISIIGDGVHPSDKDTWHILLHFNEDGDSDGFLVQFTESRIPKVNREHNLRYPIEIKGNELIIDNINKMTFHMRCNMFSLLADFLEMRKEFPTIKNYFMERFAEYSKQCI